MSEYESEIAHVDSVLADLIPEYLQNRRGDIQKLRLWLSGGQADDARKLLHQMKGSGGMYGFPRITDLARAMEEKIASGEWASCAPLIEALSRYVETVRVEYVEA